MNILSTATENYLLDSGLETLHEQSMEWISDIAFWRDEVAFLYALEISKTLKEVPISARKRLETIENDLIKVAGGDLDSLYDEVTAHERFLNRLLGSKKEDEEGYREKHAEIAEKINYFATHFKKLKREIFDLVKQVKSGRKIITP